MNIIYYPYPDLKIEWTSDEKGFRLMLPWIHSHIDVDPHEESWIKLATLHLHHAPEHPMVQKFLESLAPLPVSFQKKTNWPEEDKKPDHRFFTDLASLDPMELLNFLNISFPLEKITFLQSWEWDLDFLLKQTLLSDSQNYDPLAALTLGLSFCWKQELKTYHAAIGLPMALDLLRIQNEPLFFDYMALLLKSTLFITTQVPPLLLQAQKTFPKAKKMLQHFYQDEVGHDRLMQKALEALGHSHEDAFELPWPLILLMKLFEYAVSHSALTLTAFISLFEGQLYPDFDPLARLLEKSSKPQAARGYSSHFHINQSHNHNKEASEIMKVLPLQSRHELIIMMRILELSSHLICSLDSYFFTQILGSLEILSSSSEAIRLPKRTIYANSE